MDERKEKEPLLPVGGVSMSSVGEEAILDQDPNFLTSFDERGQRVSD